LEAIPHLKSTIAHIKNAHALKSHRRRHWHELPSRIACSGCANINSMQSFSEHAFARIVLNTLCVAVCNGHWRTIANLSEGRATMRELTIQEVALISGGVDQGLACATAAVSAAAIGVATAASCAAAATGAGLVGCVAGQVATIAATINAINQCTPQTQTTLVVTPDVDPDPDPDTSDDADTGDDGDSGDGGDGGGGDGGGGGGDGGGGDGGC
jgi:uncharacterized membrane protein YgcG